MSKGAFIVDEDVRIFGTLDADRDVKVNGLIEGALICRRASISSHATVVGDVVAERVIVRGIVDGNIYADSLTLVTNCQVYGDIHHRDLVLQEGCYFEGKSRHSRNPRSLVRFHTAPNSNTV